LEECLDLFAGETKLDGTVETGAAFAYNILKEKLPKARLLVIQRNPMECLGSLRRQGVDTDAIDWPQRVQDLWAVSAAGVRTVAYDDMELESCVRWIWDYCLGLPWNFQWWAGWHPVNVQVDMRKRRDDLMRDADKIAELKNEVRRLMEEEHHAS
jgi:hypothetical protein